MTQYIPPSKKIVIRLIALFILMIFAYSAWIFFEKSKIEYVKEPDYELQKEGYITFIDTLESKDGILTIKGWAVKKKESTKTFNMQLILKNNETGEMYKSCLQFCNREDVSQYINDGIDYHVSGFSRILFLNRLKEGEYGIYVLYDGEKKLLDTHTAFRVINEHNQYLISVTEKSEVPM